MPEKSDPKWSSEFKTESWIVQIQGFFSNEPWKETYDDDLGFRFVSQPFWVSSLRKRAAHGSYSWGARNRRNESHEYRKETYILEKRFIKENLPDSSLFVDTYELYATRKKGKRRTWVPWSYSELRILATPPKKDWLWSKKRSLRQVWVLFERTCVFTGIQFTKHFIELVFVETNEKIVRSHAIVILTR